MPSLFVRHSISDFDKWYGVFESHDTIRRKTGLKSLPLPRDASDRSIVVCFLGADDPDEATAFTEIPHSRDARMESGILGESP